MQEEAVADMATAVAGEDPAASAEWVPGIAGEVPAEAAPGPADAPGEVAEAGEEAPAAEDEAAPGEPGIPAAEVERLVDEAYRRGRNESIAELMARPGMFQSGPPAPRDAVRPPESGFLANRRPSIWDR